MWKQKSVIISLSIVLLITGGFSCWPKKSAPPKLEKAAQEKLNQEANAKAYRDSKQAWETAKQETYAVDKDFDGLTDAEEKKLGTNPESPDTDSDGLLDKDEIEIFKTDPKNPDTDGDGVKDGLEVRKGTNPKGAGKL